MVDREAVPGVRVLAKLCRAGMRFSRCCRGAALIEFAIVMSLLVLILFGVIAYSTAIFAYSAMQSGAEETARRMATGAVTAGSSSSIACKTGAALTSGTPENYACGRMPSWGTYSVTATQNCSTAGGNVPSDTLTISANASTVALGDALGLLKGKVLTVTSVQMKEGTCP
jgi:Flp pilus assembly protein TadG